MSDYSDSERCAASACVQQSIFMRALMHHLRMEVAPWSDRMQEAWLADSAALESVGAGGAATGTLRGRRALPVGGALPIPATSSKCLVL